MGTSKILIDDVGIDLTQDTIAENNMLAGIKGHNKDGDSVTGNIQTWQGTQKSGTKNITENGTFDVSEFASAAVKVGRIPAAYQEVEWVSGVGTSFVLAFDYSGARLSVDSDMAFLPGSARTIVGNSPNPGAYFGKSADGKLEMGGGVVMEGIDPMTRHRIGFSLTSHTGYIFCDGVEIYREGALTQNDWKPLGISGYYGNGVKLYGLRISVKGLLVYDLVPCYRRSDSHIGFYNLVDGSFLEPTGGTVGKGADV